MIRKEIDGCVVLEADADKRIVRDGIVCGMVVWLAVNDTAESYIEVTEQEAEELEKELPKPKEDNPETDAVAPHFDYPEVGHERTLEMAIYGKTAEITAYSDSDAVNVLSFKGIKTWLRPEVRANYDTSLSAAELLGERTIVFMVGGAELELPLADARRVLAVIQRYADQCFIVTERHKRAVRALTSVEEVDKYDYTKGYPEKLEL